MTDILSYYTAHSPITDPVEYAFLYDDLPDEPIALIRVINGILLHYRSAQHHKLQLSKAQRREQRLRTMEQRLMHIYQNDPSPLTEPRPMQELQIGWCREFAVFLVSMFRHKGVPARMRVGFEAYADKNKLYGDHWITEFWDSDESRWRLIDADIGGSDPEELLDTLKIRLNPGLDFTDLRPNMDFYLAGHIWELARQGKVKPELYRANRTWKGWPCLRGNLLHDFQALNKTELLLWDYWDELSQKKENELNAQDKALLDRIAGVTLGGDGAFEELRALYEELPRTKVIRSRLSLLGVTGKIEEADTSDLRGSDLDRLLAVIEDQSPGAGEHAHPAQARHLAQESVPPHVAKTEKGLVDNDAILIQGARQNNLRNIDVRIPRNKMVVITGVSGSGKSSLAFDTIYAEGQRRYMESLSSLARQFTRQLERPQVDRITGLNPAIAIEQKTISRTPRSTVGSVTEIVDYLRVLFARVGLMHCPSCGRAIHPLSAQMVTNRLGKLQPGTEFQILAPLNRLGYKQDQQVLEGVREGGYDHVRIDGDLFDLSEPDALPPLTKQDGHLIDLVVERVVVPEDPTSAEKGAFLTDLMGSVSTALEEGKGSLIVLLDGEEYNLSEDNACPVCEISLPKLEPSLFNANSVLGMCSECDGLGLKLQVDPDLIISRPDESLMDGASAFFHLSNLRKTTSQYWISYFQSLAEHFGADLEKPWDQLPEEFRRIVLYGSEGKKIYLEYALDDGAVEVKRKRHITGAIHNINRLFRQTKSESARRYYMQFMSQQPCPSCQGERLCLEARFVTVAGKRFSELASNSIDDLLAWVESLPGRLDEDQRLIADELLGEIQQRLGFIKKVGLGYLTLDRSAPTLSGGEGQRIRLARQIGSGLVGMLYILDEPSIGLHPRDQRDLLHTLTQLRDIGNTVLVVEHDADTMCTSDYLIDLGPGAGVMGGELVAAGTPEEVMRIPESITGQYLSGNLHIISPNGSNDRTPTNWLTLKGARLHNLKGIDIRFPLGTFICVTGVSGSGKSSLVTQTLHPALSRALQGGRDVPGPYDSIEGLEGLDRVIHITQAPIGRNPRSNPGTYVGVLPEIRKVFAGTHDARALGFPAGHFSFNVKGGRCEECQGYGARKVKLHFMADVWVPCKECEGRRFNQQTLDIRYKGLNIADVLNMDVQEALAFFSGHPVIGRILQTLDDVGLGYLKLGQSALTLSGGEAQRVKLAKELGRRATGKILYILDEPTVGLHFVDIQKLLDMLHRLVDAGNTVIVIEHNLDVINTADWIIDLGPEGGDAGGYVIAEGPPGAILQVDDSYTGRFLKEIAG